MRILMLSPSVTRAGGGVPFVVKAQARALASRGVDVAVVALQDGPLTPDELADWDGLNLSICPVMGTQRYGFSPAMLRATLAANPDVMHVHGMWQFQCAVALAKNIRSGTRYVVSPHGMLEPWIRKRSAKLKSIVSTLYQNRFLANAAAFQALTEAEANQICELVPGASAPVIPNFVESQAPTLPPPEWWSQDLEGRDIFLFLGRIHEKKGCLELCEAWDQLCTDANFRRRSALIFCGPIDGIPEFESRARSLAERWNNVQFVGPQYGRDKQRTLGRASFLCLPSKSEGLPVTILEGWAAGVIAIMTRSCNLDIGFERGAALETGTEPPAIAAAMIAASRLPLASRKKMSGNAKELIEKSFSLTAITDSLLDIYSESYAKNRLT